MKAICNQLENIIREKLASLENGIEIRTENINKHSHNRGTSHVSVNLGFDGPGEKRRLSWISCGLQFDIRHQFTIIFSRYISDEYYVKVELANTFYNLEDEKQINKLIKFFKTNFDILVDQFTNDPNNELKKKLYEAKALLEKQIKDLN